MKEGADVETGRGRGPEDADGRMSALGRWAVNRHGRGARNVAQVARCLAWIEGPAPRSALELGCGGGAVAGHLAARGTAVVATDVDIRQARVTLDRRPPGAALLVAVMDAARLALPAAAFDLVLAQFMLHHVPDWEGAVAEVARVLRPGGHLVWVDFALPAWFARRAVARSRRLGPFHGPAVVEACAAAGLSPVRHEGPGALGLGVRRAVFQKGGA